MRQMDRKKLGASMSKRKCQPHHATYFPISQDSERVLSAYPSDPVVPIAYECFFFRVTARKLHTHALADIGALDNPIITSLAQQIDVNQRNRSPFKFELRTEA